MASTYSTTLRIELIGAGDQDGTWGDTTNSNLGTIIESAITGVQPITFADANYTLTAYNGLPDEARNAVLVLGGTNTAQRNLITPAVEKTYIVKNETGANVSITTNGAGANVVVLNGETLSVFCDGTNFYPTLAGTGTLTVPNGGTGATSFTSGALLKGSGANAIATASAADIVAQIGGTFVANATNATQITNSGGWGITPSGTTLFFSYNGTNVAKLDSSGNLTALGNITAYGSV